MTAPSVQWYIYILKCADGSYYTGATTDLTRRLAQHNAGTGAKYTRSHLPVELVYSEACADRSTALQRELEVKKLSHAQKEVYVCKAQLSA